MKMLPPLLLLCKLIGLPPLRVAFNLFKLIKRISFKSREKQNIKPSSKKVKLIEFY